MPLQSRMQRLFTEGFTATEIAEPLLSFDGDVDAARVRHEVGEEVRVVGIREYGRACGYVEIDDLADGPLRSFGHMFNRGQMRRDDASLPEVIEVLETTDWCFVSALGGVGGVIGRGDFQKPAVRMWLFGMVTIIESFMKRQILTRFPDGSWKEALTDGRLQRAQELWEERRRRKEHCQLIDCLQLVDKGRILTRDREMRDELEFTSKREADDAIKALESLRNNLAHSQDIVSYNWDDIVRMSRRLDRILTRL